MAVLDAIATAYLDRERARLGLPSREELAMKRAEEQRAAALQASQLESAGLGREKMRAEIAALPAEQDLQRRLREAQIRNYDEPPRPVAEPSSMLERIMAMPPEQQAAALKLHRELNPRPDSGSQPRTGWQPQYDAATGVLKGYYHPATETFRAVGEGNLPPGTGGNIPSGEREKRGLLATMISDATRLQSLIGPADKPTAAGQKIGFWSGREQDVRSSGALAPLGVDAPTPDVLEMTHIADNLSDMLLRARSGAQINEQEYQRLRRIMPNTRGTPEAFRANLSRFIVEANNIMAARQGQPVIQPGESSPQANEVPLTKTQTNRRTGEKRTLISTDGGKTWQPQ